MRTAIQLWTLRDLAEPLPAVLERIAAAGYDGVELAGIGDPDATAAALSDAGLELAGAHVPADDLRADPAAMATTLTTLDLPYVVVPYLDDDRFADADAVAETGTTLDDLAALYDRPLLYHNHDHEFVPVGTATAYDRLIDATTVGFEVDVGWVRAAGRDPVALLETLAGRVPVVHLKDVTAAGEPTRLGDGVVDLDGVVAAAREAGTEWLVFEHDAPDDPLGAMDDAATVLTGLLGD